MNCDSPIEVAQQVASGFGVGNMTFHIEIEDVLEQTALGASTFKNACSSAIESFLNDGNDLDSPIQWVTNFDGNADSLATYMNQPSTQFWLLPKREWQAPDAWYPPERGELVAENWVFFMTGASELNALFWAVVPRDGTDVYNYGFD